MGAARQSRRVLLAGAVLVAGTALFIFLRRPPAAEKDGRLRPVSPPREANVGAPGARAFEPPVRLADAAKMSTAEAAIALAAWPEGKLHADLPQWAALLAARGPA